jgi:geranylgeranylglycerol-phosphate geranylgeranyltransferase
MLKYLFLLTRPINMFLCFVSVICGGILGDKPLVLLRDCFTALLKGELPLWSVRVLFGAFSASLILGAGNVFNDVCDVKCDRINAPYRPIPSGRVSQKSAIWFAFILVCLGFLLSPQLGKQGMIIALSAIVFLFLYDTKLKGIPLLGNLVVAGLSGLTFIYGGIAGDSVKESLLPAGFSILLHLGREFIKSSHDIRGDKRAGLTTVSTVWGVKVAVLLSTIVFLLLIVAVGIPYIIGFFGNVYFIIIVFGIIPILIGSIFISLLSPTEKNLSGISTALKWAMPIGIIAVLAGFQGW